MKDNKSILDHALLIGKEWITGDERSVCHKAMNEARIDTLEYLLEQFMVNQKKLSPKACIELIEELIKDIKK